MMDKQRDFQAQSPLDLSNDKNQEMKGQIMLNIVAIITTKPGKRADVLEAFNANVPAVLAEKGCIEYTAVVDAPDMGPVSNETR